MTVAEVSVVAQAFHDGVAARDADALAGIYHDDARFLPPGMEPAEGHDAIRAAMQGLLDMGVTSLDIEPLDVREGGDLTVEYGRYRLGIEPSGGAPVTDIGKYVVVHETRDDGSTKILFDCFNSNAQPAA
ncbi:MAG TPA: SgcJ/EcaC family oxidoreductase [Baekduia sp.]